MTTDPLLQRLSRLKWPTPAMDQPEPAPGQLWRALWHGTACLVVVLEAPERRLVRVAAASAEEIGDEKSVPAATNVGLTPTVWASVTASIKVFTLEHRLGDLTDDAFRSTLAAVAGHGPGRWPPIATALDDRVLVKAQLQDALEQLGEAEWLPQAPGTSLAEQAKAVGIGVSELRRALGTTPGDARRLLLGQRAPRPEELALLTELLGAQPGEAATYDPGLVHDLELPRFRARLERHEAGRGVVDPVALRRAFAEEMLPMAARMRGQGRRDWEALIEEVLGED